MLRSGKWTLLPGELLLPGDVFLVPPPHSSSAVATTASAAGKAGSGGAARKAAPVDADDLDVIPVDALLVAGSCITDEAVLTGESTPQWKEPIAGGKLRTEDAYKPLDVTRDKLHVLFGGTKVRSVAPCADALPNGVALPQDGPGGAPAVVLRTGFETAQGRLMRTILLSQERLTANTREAGLFICFLLCFAIAAAGAKVVGFSAVVQSPGVGCACNSVLTFNP